MRVQIARHHNGIGDWLFCLAALRWLRSQHPDVELIIDFRNAPRVVQEAFAASDLVYEDARETTARADVSIPHLVYPMKSNEPYMTGIARGLSEAVARRIEPDNTDLPFRQLQRVSPLARVLSMVGHGKGVRRGGKEWGRENFAELAEEFVAHGFEIRQVGGPRDFVIPGVAHYLGCSFVALAGILLSARAFVGLENGLMVLAGFLRVPMVTIYDGAPGADRVAFEQHLKIREPVSPSEALERITTWLG